jgi:hypothetical protein
MIDGADTERQRPFLGMIGKRPAHPPKLPNDGSTELVSLASRPRFH